MNIEEFKTLPLLGILRGVKEEMIEPLTQVIISSGLKAVEITMNTEGVQDLIPLMRRLSDEQLMIGAGTVCNMDQLRLALDAGASFIVSPTLKYDVVTYCNYNGIPVFPGALTPQEIDVAWWAGATMVKVFPAKFFGPTYMKEIKAPLDFVELMACGGVTPQNIHSFFECGASAVAFGASVFNPEFLIKREFAKIEDNLKTLIDAYQAIKK